MVKYFGFDQGLVITPKMFRVDSHGIYSISSLEPQFMYIAMMMCRIYGKENTTHFFLPWVPIIHTQWWKAILSTGPRYCQTVWLVKLQNTRQRKPRGNQLHSSCQLILWMPFVSWCLSCWWVGVGLPIAQNQSIFIIQNSGKTRWRISFMKSVIG